MPQEAFEPFKDKKPPPYSGNNPITASKAQSSEKSDTTPCRWRRERTTWRASKPYNRVARSPCVARCSFRCERSRKRVAPSRLRSLDASPERRHSNGKPLRTPSIPYEVARRDVKTRFGPSTAAGFVETVICSVVSSPEFFVMPSTGVPAEIILCCYVALMRRLRLCPKT